VSASIFESSRSARGSQADTSKFKLRSEYGLSSRDMRPAVGLGDLQIDEQGGYRCWSACCARSACR